MSAETGFHREAVQDAYESPRPDVQGLVPAGVRRVLDIGCSSGALGAAIKRSHGAEVVGIEIEPTLARDAAERLDRVITADLEAFFADEAAVAELGRFDCLIAADVLEHLRDPWAVLRVAATMLEPGGAAIISLPNVRFWETFWVLGAKGTWPRRDIGIFDRTHLQFFTASDAIDMLEKAGLQWVEITRNYRFSTLWDKPSDRYAKLFARTPLRPFFVFQHVILARRPA